MKALLLAPLAFLWTELAWAQSPVNTKTASLSIPIEAQTYRLPETCGGEDVSLSGQIALSATVSMNTFGGMDVKILSDRKSLAGTLPSVTLKGQDSGTQLYSNSIIEDFEWTTVESVPIQNLEGTKRAMVHVQWLFKVREDGEISAQIQSLTCDCGA